MDRDSGDSLEIVDVSKSFGSVRALQSVSVRIKRGEFFVLLGPSGCGKTTLIRIIAGLSEPDTGSVFLRSQCWDNLGPQERNVAMVFQNFALYPHRSVRGNIEYPLRIAGASRSERRERVFTVASMLGIENLLERRPRELSGGEAQRVALARALVRRPVCFLLDEPLGSLDAQLRFRARGEIKRIQRELGVLTLYVTHDQSEALALGDRIGLMNAGELIQVGSPRELLRSPKNTFVAGFVGVPPTNLMPATVEEGQVFLIGPKGEHFRLCAISRPTFPSHGRLIVGVAPDRVQLYPDRQIDGQGWSEYFEIPARLALVEGIEPEVVLHCETDLGPFRIRASKEPLDIGRALRFKIEDILFFDAETKERITDAN